MSFLDAVGFILVIGYGGQACLTGDLRPGNLQLSSYSSRFFMNQSAQLHSVESTCSIWTRRADRVFEILDSRRGTEAWSTARS